MEDPRLMFDQVVVYGSAIVDFMGFCGISTGLGNGGLGDAVNADDIPRHWTVRHSSHLEAAFRLIRPWNRHCYWLYVRLHIVYTSGLCLGLLVLRHIPILWWFGNWE